MSSRWKMPRKRIGATSSCDSGLWNHEGTLPTSRPDITTGWPALRSSTAISAPELPAPTMSTLPGLSWAGLRYALECSWTMPASSSAAKDGVFGRW